MFYDIPNHSMTMFDAMDAEFEFGGWYEGPCEKQYPYVCGLVKNPVIVGETKKAYCVSGVMKLVPYLEYSVKSYKRSARIIFDKTWIAKQGVAYCKSDRLMTIDDWLATRIVHDERKKIGK